MFGSFTSFYFLCFFSILLILYYLIPHKLQWIFLLLGSILYYLLAGNRILILYPIVTCIVVYVGTLLMTQAKTDTLRKVAFAAVLLVLISILFVLKYVNFGLNTINGLANLFGYSGQVITGLKLMIPLGISFYTFTILGYVIDVYNKVLTPQKNFFKLLLFEMFFPNVLSGPILRYREDGEQFFLPHKLCYQNLTYGLTRILWGIFKTLVISERMAVVVNTVYDNYEQYPGVYIWIGTICYAFQLYTNFSGCMDIALGMAQTLGLTLPENFKSPFFAKTVTEYWRRWHITLGVWMKEYVFFPLLRTGFFTSFSGKVRKKWGKRTGKYLTNILALFILWFTVGIWHGGGWKFVIGSGLLHWSYIVLEELWAPGFACFLKKIHVNPQGKAVNFFRMVRTFFLVNIGFVFFRAESMTTAFHMLRQSVSTLNVGALFDGSMLSLGLDWIEVVIAVVSLLILLTVSILQEKKSIVERLAGMHLIMRWVLLYAFLFYVILLGYYGPGYSAAEFIYQGF